MRKTQRFPLIHDLIVTWILRDARKAGISKAEADTAVNAVLDNKPAQARTINMWIDVKGQAAADRVIAILDQQQEPTAYTEELVAELRDELTGDFQ